MRQSLQLGAWSGEPPWYKPSLDRSGPAGSSLRAATEQSYHPLLLVNLRLPRHAALQHLLDLAALLRLQSPPILLDQSLGYRVLLML